MKPGTKLAVLLAIVGSPAQAAVHEFINGSGGNWSVNANWGSAPVSGTGTSLLFRAGSADYTASNDLSGVTLYYLYAHDPLATGKKVTTDGNSLILDGGANTRYIQNYASGLFTVKNDIAISGTGANTYIDTTSGDILLSGVISGSLNNIYKFSNHTLTLSGASTFSTPVYISGGTLAVTATCPNNSDSPLGNSASSVVIYNIGSAFVAAVPEIVVNRRINATPGGNVSIGGSNTTGTVYFQNYIDGGEGQTINLTAAAGGQAYFSVGVIDDARTTHVTKTGPGTVYITGGDAGGNTYSGVTTVRNGVLVLSGNDTGSAGNYALGNSANSQAVQLGDSGTGSSDVIRLLTGGPYTINHDISVNNYGIQTVVGGASGNASVFAGNITLAREMQVQSAAAGGTTSFNGAISGTGLLTKVGSGPVVLAGSNTYTGATYVVTGTLLVNGTHSGGDNYAVNAGGKLGGTGNINLASGKAVVVNSGGTLAPGASEGKLTIDGNVTLSGGSTFAVEVGGNPANAGVDFDVIWMSGSSRTFTAGGATLSITPINIAGIVANLGQRYRIVDATANSNNVNFSSFFNGLTNGGLFSPAAGFTARVWAYGSGDPNGARVEIQFVSVPEPASLTLSAAALLLMRRRKQ